VLTNKGGVLLSQCLELVERNAVEFFERDVFIDGKIVVFLANGTQLAGAKLLRGQFGAFIT
jgi:hypothetical protein